MNQTDTILAISTPPGYGGIGVIRISGKLVPKITKSLLGKIPISRQAEYLPCLSKHNTILDKVIALFFPEPHSFTGENILEIHGHGGPIILDLIIERILQISPNIRLAHPGEFTERAFLNKKMDLIQAESIADIIDATSYQAAKSASNSLQGVFSNKIHKILKKITDLRIYIESSIDFPEEKIDNLSNKSIEDTLKNIIYDIKQICHEAHSGVILRDGMQIVIAGKPNAGKSSIFNLLVESNRAIISTIAGTTRDTLHENIQFNGIKAQIIDTAGLKKNNKHPIEKIGIERAKTALKNADHILWIIDSYEYPNISENIITKTIQQKLFFINKNTPITIIYNKSDLSKKKVEIKKINHYTCITVSALLNQGIDILREHLKNYLQTKIHTGFHYQTNNNQNYFLARRRHLNILIQTKKYLTKAYKQLILTNLSQINDFFVEELKLAHYELNKIFGKSINDDLLKKIFRKFCIGK